MSCDCEVRECVDVFVNPCNTGTEIPIPATQTGNWRAMLEFNGSYRNFSFGVTTGDNISFPTFVLNEQYTHLLRLYDTSDALLGCYTMNTHYSASVDGFPVVPPETDTWQWGELTANGNILDDELLTGDLSPIIWINEQPVNWVAQGIIQTATGLDFTAIGGAFGSVIFQYKNIPD